MQARSPERGLCLLVGPEEILNREGGLQAGHHKGKGTVQDVNQGHHTVRDVGWAQSNMCPGE